MHDLQALQQHFQQFIIEAPSAIEDEIVTSEKISAGERLAIYREGYYLRIIEALQQDYAVLYLLLGETAFNQLAYLYIQQCPSPFRSLRWYGQELASFMQQKGNYEDRPYLIEMAQFEWLLLEAFDELDTPITTLEQMAELPLEKWAEARFKLHPSMRKIELRWNVPLIWKSSNEEMVTMAPQLLAAPLLWLIWRKEREVHFCSLTEDEVYLLEGMMAGNSFGELCEGLCQWVAEENVAIHAATALKRYILDDLIVEII